MFSIARSKVYLIVGIGCCLPMAAQSMEGSVVAGQSDPVLNSVAKISCRMPNQVRRLSKNFIYLAPSRVISTTAEQCGIYGGTPG